MNDDDKTKTDDVAEEATEEKVAEEKPAEVATEEPEAEEKPAEEPEAEEAEPEAKTEEPAEDNTASTDAASAGVDQQGRQLYNVKCSNCGRDTQVPFKPSGDRPVYCRDCYMQKKNA